MLLGDARWCKCMCACNCLYAFFKLGFIFILLETNWRTKGWERNPNQIYPDISWFHLNLNSISRIFDYAFSTLGDNNCEKWQWCACDHWCLLVAVQILAMQGIHVYLVLNFMCQVFQFHTHESKTGSYITSHKYKLIVYTQLHLCLQHVSSTVLPASECLQCLPPVAFSTSLSFLSSLVLQGLDVQS